MRLAVALALALSAGCGSPGAPLTRAASDATGASSTTSARPVPDLDTARYPYVLRLIGEEERARLEREIERGSPGWDVCVGELGYVVFAFAPLEALGDDRDAAVAAFASRWRSQLGLAPDAAVVWIEHAHAWVLATEPPWANVSASFRVHDDHVELRGHGWYGLPYPSRASPDEIPPVLERYVGRPTTIRSSVRAQPCDPARSCRTVEECCPAPPEAPPPRADVLRAEDLRPIASLAISFDRARGVAEIRELWRVRLAERQLGVVSEHVVPDEPIPRFVDARTGEAIEMADQFGPSEAIVAFDGDRFVHGAEY